VYAGLAALARLGQGDPWPSRQQDNDPNESEYNAADGLPTKSSDIDFPIKVMYINLLKKRAWCVK